MRLPRPYITLSWGQTLDGRIATSTGDSQWIGGPESLHFAHELRRDNQAILVGIETVLRDDPQLTCRIAEGRNPHRFVLDSRLRTPFHARIVDTSLARTTLMTSDPNWESAQNAWKKKRVNLWHFENTNSGRIDLSQVVERMGSEGISSLFVEGGARVLTAFLAQGLADRVVVVTAPWILGAGIDAVGDLGHQILAEAPRPKSWRRWDLGNDSATELLFR